MSTMSRKRELERELEKIQADEREAEDKKEREQNWKLFLSRPSDWLIGKAHAEQLKDNGWHKPKGELLPASVSIHGNMGETYYPTASLVGASFTYFHNVWRDKDRREFQRKLNELVQAEVERISKSLTCILEILGLQSNAFWLNKLPRERVPEARKMIWQETVALLDAYSDQAFLDLRRGYSGISINADGEGEPVTGVSTGLSHSNTILFDYLTEKRPHLLESFESADSYQGYKQRNKRNGRK